MWTIVSFERRQGSGCLVDKTVYSVGVFGLSGNQDIKVVGQACAIAKATRP
ncbi:hypothetical protein CYD53_106241 [Bosea psychrotolerans]|uniref:Uncharacterized protein n=1 Tax=Bosea psychrotolerans TaxID=1871628 RepID=A0A2S4MBT5_9HYPH|nr:hypothetical protein CYD53_106241 [Bosea psychrotolerans]